MIEISFKEKLESPVNKTNLKKILKIFLKQLFKIDPELSLYITDNNEIQKLNKKYRKINRPTDILSWAYYENTTRVYSKNGQYLTGEIVISAERVREQAIANGWDFDTELIRLIAHGCVHIAGFDHHNSEKEEKEMLDIEIKLLKLIGINNIY